MKAKKTTAKKTTTRTTGGAQAPTKKALVLRVCNADMSAYGGFVWPKSGPVAAPDWRNNKNCGHGLHGWLWGEGDINVANVCEDSQWLVVEVELDAVIDLGGKVKFPKGVVLYTGDVKTATDMIYDVRPGAIIKGTATAGTRGTATAGTRGTATAGYGGTATVGDSGTATAGYGGTATAGDSGTATAGDSGTATAGELGILIIRRFDGQRYRNETAYVGENGILPNVAYKLEGSIFVPVKS